jgi:hypothetical protein
MRQKNNITPMIVINSLGHSRAGFTLDVYGHLMDRMQGDAANLMDGLITPVKLFPIVPDPVNRNN